MTIVGNDPAYLEARFGIARFGASRFGALTVAHETYDNGAVIIIGGVVIGGARDDAFDPGILRGSLVIQDVLDDRPNTASFSAWNFKPPIGTDVVVTLGSPTNPARLFAGYVMSVNQIYLSKPVNRVFHCSCIDYTWRLMQQKANGRYLSTSVTTIVNDLLARYAPTVSNAYVQTGLPSLSEFTVTNEDLPATLKRLASRIGAYFYVDYRAALHFFTTEAKTPPLALTPDHPSLSAVEREQDLSQLITRAVSEGGGGTALVELVVGATTIPVDVGTWYAPGGGRISVGPNRAAYTGVVSVTGAGSLVGPGVTPTVPPTTTPVNGGTLAVGTYKYAVTFQTAAGESKPSPLASVTTVARYEYTPPTVAPAVALSQGPYFGGELTPGSFYQYAVSYTPVDFGGGTIWTSAQTLIGPASAPVQADGVHNFQLTINWELIQPGNHVVRGAMLYRSRDGGPFKLFAWQGPSFQNPIYDLYHGDSYTANSQSNVTVNGAIVVEQQQVQISNIQTGPSGTTARKIYRTTVDGSQLKLLTTLAGNASTGPLVDTAADATLGANAPTGDTSGLQGVTGQVNAGDTSMIVAGTGWADPSGGWAIIGNGRQVVHYAGTTATALTGIPTTGIGSIVGAVPYNSSVTAAPTLTGVTGLLYGVPSGTPVNVLAVIDNADAQAALRATVPGHSGIVEEFIADGRLSLLEATARANALLSARVSPLVTLRYNVRDITTRSGATITADLPPPTDIHDVLKIQQVTIDGFDLSPGADLPPTFHATASSERFTFEDLLRQMRPAE